MLPPIVERELRVALLRRQARREWLLAACTAGGICFFFLLVLDIGPHRYTGRALFFWLFSLAAASVAIRGFGLTADLFSEERRSGTLGLLVLTGLRPAEIFLYKLLGASLIAAYGLLGALPFFSIPFLAGGVPGNQFFCALVFLANGLLFCVALGLLASVIHHDGGQAQVTAVGLAAILCLTPPLMRAVQTTIHSGLPMPPKGWLALSPGVAPALIYGKFAGPSLRLFWLSSGFTLAYSLTALLLAVVILQRTWRDGPETLAPQLLRLLLQKWTRGGERWRRRLRARYLSHQPFCWMSVRDQLPVLLAYAFLGIVIVLWFVGWTIGRVSWLRPGRAFASSIVVHVGLNWILCYAAGRPLAEERQTGGFEVLLTTPVSPKTIIHGHSRGLLIQFRTAFLCAFALDWIFCASTFGTLTGTLAAVLLYLLAWAVLMFYWYAMHLETASFAMWISAWTGRAAYAATHAFRTIRTNLGVLICLSIFFSFLAGMAGNRNAGAVVPSLRRSSPGALIAFDRRRTVRDKLAAELKWIAAAPIPSRGDKRFKSWNPQMIYPPGRWGELELRPATTRRHRHRHA